MAAFNCRHRGGAPAPGAINHQLIWRQPPPPATPIPAAKPRRSRRDSAAIAPVTKPAELMTARQPLSVVVATLTLHGPASAWGRAPPPAPEAHSLPGGAALAAGRHDSETPPRRRIHEICHRHKGVSLHGTERDRRAGAAIRTARDRPPGMSTAAPFHPPRNAAYLAPGGRALSVTDRK